MEEIKIYKANLKKRPKLLSEQDIKTLLEVPMQSSHESSKEIFTVKNFAMAGGIAILIGLAFLFTDNLSPLSKESYTSYYEYRYASLVHNIQKKPNAYQTKLFLSPSKNDEIPIYLATYIEPSIELLNKMGFTFSKTGVIYEANVKSTGYIRLGMKNERASVSISGSKKEGFKTYDFYPLFLSEMDGRQGVRYSFDNEPKEKLTDKFFQERRNALIPIVIKVPGKEVKVIFWFLPTESLFKILDNGNVKPKETEDTYQSKAIEELKIYPNPSKEFLTVRMSSKENSATIHVLDLNGQSIEIIPPKFYKKNAEVFYDIDIRNIPNGIYLLSIEFDNGAKIIKRIIKN